MTAVELNVSLEIHFNFYEIDNDEAGDNNQKTIVANYSKPKQLHLNT